MDVYMYQAALWCVDCGESIRKRLNAELLKAGLPENPADETSDSDDYPKGPYPDGGGESDSPEHCDGGEACINRVGIKGCLIGVPLENPLTPDGVAYVREAIANPSGVCSKLWAELYADDLA